MSLSRYPYLVFIVSYSLFFSPGAFAAGATEKLTLQQAETLALATDHGTRRLQSLSQSMQELSIAAGQLPDPQLKLGLANFPTDTFNINQEPMTQVQVGLQQMFPRGDSLQIKSKKSLLMGQAYDHRAQDRQREILKKVRLNWLELYYWTQAESIVRKNKNLFEQLVDVAHQQYAAGRRNQQDVVLAELEFNNLDDRILQIKTKQETLAAELAVLIGKPVNAFRLPTELPELVGTSSREVFESALTEHPKIMLARAQVETEKENVALAREAYKPGWGVGVTYGFRNGQNPNGSERADFLSVGVNLDLPLFREKRQDRKLQASQYQLGASQQMLDQQYLDLRQTLNKDLADWRRLQERVDFYQATLIPQTRQNIDAALFAYQNDRADFSTVMKARITRLNTQLKSIRMDVDRSKAEARLLYILGENNE